ncbi:MAG TPA: regulatory protein RecX [Nitrospiria bacterium]|nr:regulatory protein RecX [Nitrospiria bacterium]
MEEDQAAGRCRKSIGFRTEPSVDVSAGAVDDLHSDPPLVASDPARARETAYRFLARRVHSREEVARRLRGRGFREEIVEQTLDLLAGLGYLDDARFAEIWVRNRMGLKGYGRNLLQRELLERGVSKEVIREAIMRGEVDEEASARRVLERKFHKGREGRSAGNPDPKDWRRAYDYLLRRGFPSDLVRKVLKEQWQADLGQSNW